MGQLSDATWRPKPAFRNGISVCTWRPQFPTCFAGG